MRIPALSSSHSNTHLLPSEGCGHSGFLLFPLSELVVSAVAADGACEENSKSSSGFRTNSEWYNHGKKMCVCEMGGRIVV